MTKRRWFRIHLSTAIVMMFVAGVLLWANLRQTSHILECNPGNITLYQRGWPYMWSVDGTESDNPIEGAIQMRGAVLDSFTAIAFLGATSVICEFLIRRAHPSQRQSGHA